MKNILALTGTALLLCATTAFAEVGVELNSAGRVNRLSVRVDLEGGGIWSRVSALPAVQLLNPDGDLLSDRIPTCGILALPTQDAAKTPPRHRSFENALPGRGRTPIVAWPRFDGTDWEIVYSMWSYRLQSWTAVSFVESGDNEVDDYDPRLIIKANRVILLWRRGSGPDNYALTTAGLVAVGDNYEIEWNHPVELTSPPGMNPDDFLELSLPQILGSGVGSSDVVVRSDP